MNKTKKITSLLLAFTLALTFLTTSTFADDNEKFFGSSYDGVYEIYNNSPYPATISGQFFSENDFNLYPIEKFSLTIENGYATWLMEANKTQIDFSGKLSKDDWEIYIGDYVKGCRNYLAGYNSSMNVSDSTTLYIGDESGWGSGSWYTKWEIIKVSDIPTEPQYIETSFGQKVVTDSGQYEMYVSGFVNANVVNGENVLTSADIAKQNINIHAKNTVTGEIRVMTQSTIEGMTLNVSGGTVTSITLKGRVQTSKGTLERYTTTVNL